ncbi:hypothetical protein BDF21DRAFT_347703 [Thamnidium elegans]|nr:hypothetical protein BDF21DRAFT_347703 [Thamnidium elegans]
MNSQSLYDKAVRSYLLTKYTPAANTCNKAILAIKQDDDEALKVNIWALYLNIASTLLVGASTLPPAKLFGLDQTTVSSVQDVCRSIWIKLVQAYQPLELMDHKLVSACLVLDLKLNQFAEAREVAESWFACLPDLVLDDIANGRQSDESYIEIVQLYTCRILPAMNDFESAITFLEYNSVLTDSKKKVFIIT